MLYHRFLGVSPTQYSLKRILSSSPRRRQLPSPSSVTTSPEAQAPTVYNSTRRGPYRQRLSIEITKPSASVYNGSPPPTSLVLSASSPLNPSPLYVSIPLTLPSLVPLPRSPQAISTSKLPDFDTPSTPPSLSSSPTLSLSAPPSPITPNSPLVCDFASLPRKAENPIRRNRFNRNSEESFGLA